MSGGSSCALCGKAIAGRPHRTCGADLCAVCHDANLVERMGGRGFALREENWTSRDRVNDSIVTYPHTKVSGVVPIAPAPQAEFSREGIGTRIVKFFGGHRHEPQAGDPLFDDMIFVEGDTPEITRRMLQHEGIQSVVMEAVSEYGNIRFDPVPEGTQVTVHSVVSSQTTSRAKSGEQRVVAIALVHLQAALG